MALLYAASASSHRPDFWKFTPISYKSVAAEADTGEINDAAEPNRTISRNHFCHELLEKEKKRTVQSPIPYGITLAALISRYLFVVGVLNLPGIVQSPSHTQNPHRDPPTEMQ
jgi:hypothetical protein